MFFFSSSHRRFSLCSDGVKICLRTCCFDLLFMEYNSWKNLRKILILVCMVQTYRIIFILHKSGDKISFGDIAEALQKVFVLPPGLARRKKSCPPTLLLQFWLCWRRGHHGMIVPGRSWAPFPQLVVRKLQGQVQQAVSSSTSHPKRYWVGRPPNHRQVKPSCNQEVYWVISCLFILISAFHGHCNMSDRDPTSTNIPSAWCIHVLTKNTEMAENHVI